MQIGPLSVNSLVSYSSYTDISAKGGLLANGSTTNVRINTTSGSGNISLGATTTTVNTLLQNTSTAAIVATASKVLQINGIMIGTVKAGLTIGANVGDGSLSSATSGGELFFYNYSSNTLLINAPITNNGTTSPLVKSGSGLVTLAGTNTYSGNTYINSGTLAISATGNNIQYSPTITIASPATLDVTGVTGGFEVANSQTITGGGTIGGAINVSSGGTIAPGNGSAVGTLTTSTTTGNVTFNSGSTLSILISGSNASKLAVGDLSQP